MLFREKKLKDKSFALTVLKGPVCGRGNHCFWTYGAIEYCLESLLGYIVCLELVSFKEKRGEKQQMNDKCKVCNDQSYRLEAVLFKQYYLLLIAQYSVKYVNHLLRISFYSNI